MIYELKKYVANPGMANAMVQRFERVAMPIFTRLGIEVQQCWICPTEADAFYYTVKFDSVEAADKAWKAFGADAQWKAAKTASETNGPLLASQTTTRLVPTGFSPSHG